MKLYAASKLSPFASRVRLPVYAKTLPVEIVPTPGGSPHASEYLAINPLGKIPSLVLEDGTVIPESDTIVEFFADAFPEARLRPSGASAIARARLLARMSELYVMNHAQRLFMQMDPATRSWVASSVNMGAVDEIFGKVRGGLAHLNRVITEDTYAVGDTLTTADCALVPLLAFLDVFATAFGRGDFLAPHAKLATYWARVPTDPSVQKLIGEMQQGLGERIKP